MTTHPAPTVLARGLGFTEGPVALTGGTVAFTSLTRGRVYRWSALGLTSVYLGAGPTGLALDSQEAIYVAQCSGLFNSPHENPAGVVRLVDAQVDQAWTDGLNAPNDLCFGPDGLLYFTDPGNGQNPGRVMRLDPVSGDIATLHHGGAFPNGLAFTPEGDALLVAESDSRRLLRYPLEGAQLGTPEVLADIQVGAPDGMALDDSGHIWQAVPASDSILVLSPSGEQVDQLACGEGSFPSNCCFGGPEGRTLYVTAAGWGALLACEVRVRGLDLHPRQRPVAHTRHSQERRRP